jgi:membrane protease YdiL (CAAX protease family)
LAPAAVRSAPSIAVPSSEGTVDSPLPSAAPASASLARSAAASPSSARTEGARGAAAVAAIEGGAASWETRDALALDGSAVPAAASDGVKPLPRATESAKRPVSAAPAPEAPRARPRAARAAFAAGAVLIGAAAISFAAPALIPAAFAAAKGPALYAGLALLNLARFWRAADVSPGSPRGPPAAASGWFKTAKAAWSAAREGADAQVPLEARAGNSSIRSFRNWWLGGLRAAAFWIPVAVAGMVAGWGIAKPFAWLGGADDSIGMISLDALEKSSLVGHVFGYVASSLSAEALSLGAFDAVGALARRFGAGRASVWIGGAAAMALSAVLIASVTTAPSVLGPMLGIEAALLWLRARSGSWLAPLALRAIFSMFTLESVRLSVGMALGTAGTLAGLPAFAGIAVSGILAAALAWSAGGLRLGALASAFKAQLARVKEFGAAWRTPRADGAPHSPWTLFKLAALWGTILYAVGDLVYGGLHLAAGGTEPTPAVLVQMLSSPADLVLYNFLIVGFLEEYVFRRGMFKSIFGRLQKWGLTGGRLFWAAAVASGLIFSYAHYVDFGALLAKIGIGDNSSVSTGMYAFTLGGFASRAVLGVILAWLYAASGTLILPILAHFCADSLEGLGLHFGFVPFLAMVAGGLLVQRVWKKSPRP